MPTSTMPRSREPRDDFRPVIVGGDLGSYAMGREFYEAFGVRSYCVAPEPISAIARSAIFDVVPLSKMDAPNILKAIQGVARLEAPRRLLVTSNMDIHVRNISAIESDLPEGAVALVAPAAMESVIIAPRAIAASLIAFCRITVLRDIPICLSRNLRTRYRHIGIRCLRLRCSGLRHRFRLREQRQLSLRRSRYGLLCSFDSYAGAFLYRYARLCLALTFRADFTRTSRSSFCGLCLSLCRYFLHTGFF